VRIITSDVSQAAVEYYPPLGVTIRRFLTDNGSGYRFANFRHTCRWLGVQHEFNGP
jgi:hypothetical protein